MPHLLWTSQSDPLSPPAQELWSQVVHQLRGRGWDVTASSVGPAHWRTPWTLTADPTGGSSALAGLSALVETLPPAPTPDVARKRAWWSMSDNSLVLNALVDRGVCRIFHGHPLTLGGRDGHRQWERWQSWVTALGAGAAFPPEALPPLSPLRGLWPSQGTLVGGNLGALERLGTTPWRPRPQGRILLVESLSASAQDAPVRILALLADPWWQHIGGLVLGRFTGADRSQPTWFEPILARLPPGLPVARWSQVGHGADGWTIPLGEEVGFTGI